MSQLKIKDPGTGEERLGTAKDFDELMQLNHSDPDRAAEAVELLFGAKAATVASYMTRVNEALQAMNEARDDYRTKGSARDKERAEKMSKLQEEIGTSIKNAWQKYSTEPVEKMPQYFKPVEGDDTGNALLEKGMAQARFALSHLNPSDPNLTAKERDNIVRAHAAMFYKAAAFNRLVHFLKTRDSRIAELEKELGQFKQSEPKSGDGASPKPGKGKVTWEEQLDSMAR